MVKLSSYTNAIIETFGNILKTDGMVTRDELLEMLRVDEIIPEKYQNEDCYQEMADKILNNFYIKNEADERKMKLYKQGLSAYEIAEKEGVNQDRIKYWLKKRGLKAEKKEPARTGDYKACKTCKYYKYYTANNK